MAGDVGAVSEAEFLDLPTGLPSEGTHYVARAEARVDRPRVSFVLGTVNERETLPIVIRQILDLELPSYEVVVVDDGSTDGTRSYLEALAVSHGAFRPILHNGKRTLSPALFEGARASRGDFVIVMDADGQHPPGVVPQIVAALEAGAALAVASRYSEGGSVGNRSALRAAISRTAELIAKLLLPEARGVRDPLSGYFGFRRSFANLNFIPRRGYKPLLVLLRMCRGELVTEIPFQFGQRDQGASKITSSVRFVPNFLSEILTARRVPNLRPKPSVRGEAAGQVSPGSPGA